MRGLAAVVCLCLVPLSACQPQAAAAVTPSASSSAPAAAASSAPKADEPEKGRGGKEKEKEKEPPHKFALPFVRDGEEDPFDRARGFLRDLLSDNASFVRQHDPKYFKPFVEAQKPRATLVTCSDSRVQSPAFDAAPDNDLFTIRNIGNQVATSAGSVEYGVGHLKTPVLIILGHTGCGAVKAAMGDFSGAPSAIRKELSTLDLSPLPKDDEARLGAKEKPEKERAAEKKKADAERSAAAESMTWTEGVLNNVHRQVAEALAGFPSEVAGHDLIVVGAVYDLRNDLHKGQGLVHIVNVNGRTEPANLAAFQKAVQSGYLAAPASSEGGVTHAAGVGSSAPHVSYASGPAYK